MVREGYVRNEAVASEGIDRVSRSGRLHVRLQPVAVHHVHLAVEQIGDVILQAGVLASLAQKDVTQAISYNSVRPSMAISDDEGALPEQPITALFPSWITV